MARLHFYPFFLSLSSFPFITFWREITSISKLFYFFCISNTKHTSCRIGTRSTELYKVHALLICGDLGEIHLSPYGDPIVSVKDKKLAYVLIPCFPQARLCSSAFLHYSFFHAKSIKNLPRKLFSSFFNAPVCSKKNLVKHRFFNCRSSIAFGSPRNWA